MNLRTFFCAKCYRQCLRQFRNKSEIKIENIKVRSLFRWPPGESDVLSALVLQMKEESQHEWRVWAAEFVSYLDEAQNKRKTILVTSESLTGKKHSQNWAEALSFYLGYPQCCPLMPVNGTMKQRERNRLERTERVFSLSVEFSKPRNTRIIFVDDVVTTGQTALAAYKALKEPPDFEVWSLIYREL